MKILEILSLAVLGVTLAVLIRPFRPEMSMIVGVATGLILLLYAVGEFTGLIGSLRQLALDYGLDTRYIGILLKIIGIAYAAQFGAQICKDAGETAVAGKVELCGRVMILAAAVPATVATLSTAVRLLIALP